MAASRPKSSVKQPRNPEFVYDFPTTVFPTDCDLNALNAMPSMAAQSAVQPSGTTKPAPPSYDQEEICKILQDS